ncbi:MAG: hypothetical protein A2114_00115 [Candidatus Vogelbacteria bacterium GWA1_51_14]|uniref:Uncharacterized protein n=1 Tax=Candidatus Vogelbacteria bacterium GWA1_51_14 TaxID=1802435 RepID=A0A1G2QAE0_9BACT|nr:MAG: hypothetical protein A2114_00115 [Candidatus Vogelbacteria bacterium GWA1_51_14]
MSKPSPANRQVYLLIVILLTALALVFGHFSTNQPGLEKAPLISSNAALFGAISSKDDDEPPPPPPPPSYLDGKVISPDSAVTGIKEKELINIPLFGKYEVNWYLNSYGQDLYSSSCQIRLDNEVIGSAGYSGNSIFTAKKTTRSRRDDEGPDVNLYCLYRNDPRDIIPSDPYVDTRISDLELSVDNCEASFDGILYGFANSTVFPVKITEDSFKEWAENDSFDRCEYVVGQGCTDPRDVSGSSRSGDRYDIETAMEASQCSSLSTQQFIDGFLSGGITSDSQALDGVMSLTNINRPAPIAFLLIDNFYTDQVKMHMVIALKIVKSSTSGLKYTIDVLDPNGPSVISGISCSSQKIPNDSGGLESHLICDYPGLGWAAPVSTSLLALAQNLNQRFSSKCLTYNNLEICQERKVNMSGWLRSNYPSIPNYVPEGGQPGICYGWTTFVLQTTYLAQFEGECLHQ